VRRFGLMDLLAVGVGGTLGTGVFVLSCVIAKDYAGPASFISWLLAGAATLLAAVGYAELAARFPNAGGNYAYTYVAMGEVFAVLTGWCLVLEYAVGTAAVARAWGDKMNNWLADDIGLDLPGPLQPGRLINPAAAALQLACCGVMLLGAEATQRVANVWTLLKVTLVLFIIVTGATAATGPPSEPFMPSGAGGVMSGAMAACYGYIGWDEICCMAGEAKDPHRTLPRAINGTIIICAGFYAIAAIVLAFMLPSSELDDEAGFSAGFDAVGLEWAGTIVSVGELATLPVVVLLGCIAQPRIQYAIALDGLLPAAFRAVDADGNLVHGILISGAVMTLVALLAPFNVLDGICSAGVLVAFQLTNCSLVLVRVDEAARAGADSARPRWLLLRFCVASLAATVALDRATKGAPAAPCLIVAAALFLASLFFGRGISAHCRLPDPATKAYYVGYRAPGVPWVQLLSLYCNWYLLAQLDASMLLAFVLYAFLALAFYLAVGVRASAGNTVGWRLSEDAPGADLKDLLLADAVDEEAKAADWPGPYSPPKNLDRLE